MTSTVSISTRNVNYCYKYTYKSFKWKYTFIHSFIGNVGFILNYILCVKKLTCHCHVKPGSKTHVHNNNATDQVDIYSIKCNCQWHM